MIQWMKLIFNVYIFRVHKFSHFPTWLLFSFHPASIIHARWMIGINCDGSLTRASFKAAVKIKGKANTKVKSQIGIIINGIKMELITWSEPNGETKAVGPHAITLS